MDMDTDVVIETVDMDATSDEVGADADFLETLNTSAVPFTESAPTSDRRAFWGRLNTQNNTSASADALDSITGEAAAASSCASMSSQPTVRHIADPKTSRPNERQQTPASRKQEIIGFYCGGGTSGQLGNGRSSNILELVPLERGVINQHDIAFIACSMHHSLLCTKDGVMFSCGANEHGELGRSGQKRKLFRAIESIPEHIAMVAAGQNFGVVLAGPFRLFDRLVRGYQSA